MLYNIEKMPPNIRPLKILNWVKIKNIKSSPVELNPTIQELGWRLVKTCLLEDGIGLAAPQCGIFKQIIVCREMEEGQEYKFKPEFKLYINPIFEANLKKGKTTDKEYCLSVPGQGFEIKRFNEIKLIWDEKAGKQTKILKDWPARLVQHEIEHLRGISIPQRFQLQNKTKTKKK